MLTIDLRCHRSRKEIFAFFDLTATYAFGHTLEAGLIKATTALGGSRAGGDLVPLGTSDYSSYLIKAQAANPDVIMLLIPATT